MKTRESKKAAYISNFKAMFKNELIVKDYKLKPNEEWIEKQANEDYLKRKEEIKSKADALMYGIIDGKEWARFIMK